MPEIWEVILTGGDPLMLSAGQLRDTLAALAAMEHVKVVRFHTRTPIAAPNLVSADHLAVFAGFEKALYMALHINHAQELTPQVRDRIKALDKAGIVMLSQSVLLRGVNDDVEALAALFRELVALKVKPYMLHHMDYAPGTAHFRVPISEGRRLMRALRGRLSGLCQPEYMLDIPGGYGKIPLTPAMPARKMMG